MKKFCWYDVCNDFTLEVREGMPQDLLECEPIDGYFWRGCAFYKDEEEGELYFFGVEGLGGQTLDTKFGG